MLNRPPEHLQTPELPPAGFGTPPSPSLGPISLPSINIGDVGNAILNALDAPRTGFQNVLAGALSGGTQDREMIEEWKRQNADAWAQGAPGPLGAVGNFFGASPYDVALGVGGQAVDFWTDPLNLLGGLGTWAKVGTKALPASVQAAHRADIIRRAEMIDALPSKALAGLLKGAKAPTEEMAGGVLETIARSPSGLIPATMGEIGRRLPERANPAKWFRPMLQEGTGQRQANDIMDALRATSRESQHAQATERVVSGADYLARQNRNLYRDVADDLAIAKVREAGAGRGEMIDALTQPYHRDLYMGVKEIDPTTGKITNKVAGRPDIISGQ